MNTESKSKVRIGWGFSGLASLFFLVDGAMKLVQPQPVLEATVKLGMPIATLAPIGVVLLCCTVLYLIPRLSVLGAILLTGYLGGAVATHVRAEGSAFEITFPIVFGVIAWGGLWLRNAMLRRVLVGEN